MGVGVGQIREKEILGIFGISWAELFY